MPLKIVPTSPSANAAIAHERRRISRDLHDSTIQPYIGLKLGLEALRRRLDDGSSTLAREVDELIELAGEGINELRRYVGNLKSPERRRPAESILRSVRSQARRFSDYYGLPTEVHAETDVAVPAVLCDEVTQIVREALSNIRRHTEATRAGISLRVEGNALVLEVENDRGGPAAPVFHPRSIGERVLDLGGRVHVARRPQGTTLVAIHIPLKEPWRAF